MPDKILDYAIGPIGRSILIARAGNTRPRGMPSNTIPYPTGVDTESMLLEIPVSEMYENTYCILLSSNKDMEETYELFDRGALQFIRPEHAANPHDPPMKRTNQVHVKSGEYFRHGNLNEPEDKLQLTILNGGDSFQYGRHPYMHVKNTLQKAGYPVSNLSIDQPQESTKAAVFTFEYADNEYYIQPRLDPVPRFPSSGESPKSHE